MPFDRLTADDLCPKVARIRELERALFGAAMVVRTLSEQLDRAQKACEEHRKAGEGK